VWETSEEDVWSVVTRQDGLFPIKRLGNPVSVFHFELSIPSVQLSVSALEELVTIFSLSPAAFCWLIAILFWLAEFHMC